MDWPSTWFQIVERLGESMKIISAKIDASGKPQWVIREHTQVDGVGALTHFLLGPQAAAPQAKQREGKGPGVFKTLIAIYKHVRDRSQKTLWKIYDPSKVGTSPILAWTIFPEDTSRALKEFALSEKVSLNTLLLLTLDLAVRAQLLEGGETRWSIPVNLRGLIPATEQPNQVSFLNVKFTPALSLKEFQQRISAKFKEGNHWANWALIHVGKYVGLERTEKAYRKSYEHPNPETGTFSGLGEWQSAVLAPNEAFITAAPCSKLTPVTFAAVSVNGKLSVVLQLHPSLNPTPSDITNLLQLWIEKLGDLSKINLSQQKIFTEKVNHILSGYRLGAH